MKEKIKQLFDSRATWALIGTFAGLFGEKAAAAVQGLGVVVMAII